MLVEDVGENMYVGKKPSPTCSSYSAVMLLKGMLAK